TPSIRRYFAYFIKRTPFESRSASPLTDPRPCKRNARAKHVGKLCPQGPAKDGITAASSSCDGPITHLPRWIPHKAGGFQPPSSSKNRFARLSSENALRTLCCSLAHPS